MTDISGLGRLIMMLGVVLLVVGALIAFGPRVGWLGRLPGDFVFGGPNWKVYLPLGTCLVISLILSLVMWLFGGRK